MSRVQCTTPRRKEDATYDSGGGIVIHPGDSGTIALATQSLVGDAVVCRIDPLRSCGFDPDCTVANRQGGRFNPVPPAVSMACGRWWMDRGFRCPLIFGLVDRIAIDTIESVERARAGGMNPRVYIETSVVDYVTALPVRDIVTLGNLLATRAWWLEASNRFDLVVSELVLEEVAAGDPTEGRARRAAVASLPMLAFDKESADLGRHLIRSHAIPSGAEQAAAHVAIATVNKVDYLATWNLRHIANPRLIPLIDKACRDRSYAPAVTCTPNQLGRHDVEDPRRDPIMAELREIRAQVVAEVGNDPRALMEYVTRKRAAAAADSGGHPQRGEGASMFGEHSEP